MIKVIILIYSFLHKLLNKNVFNSFPFTAIMFSDSINHFDKKVSFPFNSYLLIAMFHFTTIIIIMNVIIIIIIINLVHLHS